MTVARIVLLIAAVFCGLSAGFFYTYEASITLGLAEVDDTTYVNTFQALNATIRNPGFGIMFFGTIPAIVAALALNWRARPLVRWLIAAGLALYLACLAITGTGNVPLNNDLAEVASVTSTAAAEARQAFEDDWNRLNLIRTIAVVAGFAALTTAVGLSPVTD